MSEGVLTITYEDGSVVTIPVPDESLLHAAPWIDTMIALFDPMEKSAESVDNPDQIG